jgi:hypothetical protein
MVRSRRPWNLFRRRSSGPETFQPGFIPGWKLFIAVVADPPQG